MLSSLKSDAAEQIAAYLTRAGARSLLTFEAFDGAEVLRVIDYVTEFYKPVAGEAESNDLEVLGWVRGKGHLCKRWFPRSWRFPFTVGASRSGRGFVRVGFPTVRAHPVGSNPSMAAPEVRRWITSGAALRYAQAV